jgi:hypothetical protein
MSPRPLAICYLARAAVVFDPVRRNNGDTVVLGQEHGELIETEAVVVIWIPPGLLPIGAPVLRSRKLAADVLLLRRHR